MTGHPGPTCDMTTGACGTTCVVDADCPVADWCSQAGVCTPKTPNGQPLPTAAPVNGTCNAVNGARACTSGVCDTDGKCGYASGDGNCTAGDAGTGVTVCRTMICASSGPNADKCAQCLTDADCSGATPACNLTSNECVQCTATNATACTAGMPACDVASSICVSVVTDAGPDAAGDAAGGAASDAASTSDVSAEAGEASEAGPSPPSGGTIEGGGLSCSMSRSRPPLHFGLLTVSLAFGVSVLGFARRRRRSKR
jgi:hypothetical protein